jgi:membrane protein DedA with SNARE-associated domain
MSAGRGRGTHWGVFPGEIAVLLGGVAASQGSVSIAGVLIAACLGAVLGDQVGDVVGREWGERVLSKLPDRLIDRPSSTGRLRSYAGWVPRVSSSAGGRRR